MLKFIIVFVVIITEGFAGSPSKPPLVDRCDFKQRLYRPDGSYLKSVCIVYDPKGLNDTIKFCESLNMEILDVPPGDDYLALYQIKHEYIAPFSADFWVKSPNSTVCYMAELIEYWIV